MQLFTKKTVVPGTCQYGADPEVFIGYKGGGAIVGSEQAIPAEGIQGNIGYVVGKIVRDGVQVELHPGVATCRQVFSMYVWGLLKQLRGTLTPLGLELSLAQTIDLTEVEFQRLGEDAKLLGCMPSLNAYDVSASIYTPVGFKTRSAGGHIHMGLLRGIVSEANWKANYGPTSPLPFTYVHREDMVKVLDILVGNTAVLLDRDPRAAERRQTYGRAGEYRLPDHGLEYRTLSNFWLNHYPTFSLILGLVRQAEGIVNTAGLPANNVNPPWNTMERLFKLVDLDKVRTAINTNDANLAWDNFEGVKNFISDHVKENSTSGLLPSNLAKLEYFAQAIQSEGWNRWKGDALYDGETERFAYSHVKSPGWEQFASALPDAGVRKDRSKTTSVNL